MQISLRGICLSLVTALAALPLAADVLCIGTATVAARKNAEQCRSEATMDVIVPNDAARAFIVIKPEAAAFILGEIPPRTASWRQVQKEATVPVAVAVTAAETIDSLCTLSLDPHRENEEAAGRTPKWSIDLPAPATGERRLMVPAGRYKVAIDCKGFVPAETTVKAEAKAQPARVNLAVLPVPRVSGRVIAPEPTIALIHDHDERLLGQTDADGRFQLSILPKEWPGSLSVSAPGLGTVVVKIPPKAARVELPDIELRKAGRVSITGAPEILRQIESVEVLDMRDRHNRKPYLNVRKETLRAKEYVIADIQPGPYLVVLAGSQPLERFGQMLDVAAGETVTVHTDWTPEEVEVRTFLGDDVLGNAELLVQSVKYWWKASFTTSAEGVRTVRLWQPGEFGYLLNAAGDVGHGDEVVLDGTPVEIRVPNRTVEGKVVDAATGEPLAGVLVGLENPRHGIRVKTSVADGTFRFVGVEPGRYRLSGGGAQGLSHEAVRFEVAEQMSLRQVRLALRRQAELELELVTAHGTPAGGATVIELAGNHVAGLREADEAGRVRLPRLGAPRSIVVLTPDGGLHAQPLPAAENRGTLRVDIPRLTSAISILIESSGDHKPITGVSLAMRINGVLFPEMAMQLIADRAGLPLKSAADGRIRLPRVAAGTYEFWPVRSRSDIEAFVTGQLGAAPIVLVAGPGENVAKLTFARVAPRAETP